MQQSAQLLLVVLETQEGLTGVMQVSEQEGTFGCSGLHLPTEENYLPLCQYSGCDVEVTALSFHIKFGMLENSGLEVLPISQKRITQVLGVVECLQ